jgi:hypothetical protein
MIIIAGAILTNCTFNEKFLFNEDGSGKYEVVIDNSSIFDTDKSLEKENDKESITDIDSTYTIADVLAPYEDSIKKLSPAEQLSLSRIKDFKVNWKVAKKGTIEQYTISKEFNQVAQIDNAFYAILLALSLSKGDMPRLQYNNNFSYSNKRFKSKVKLIKDVTLLYNEEDEFNLEMYKLTLGTSIYSVKYTFPNEIKSTTLKGNISNNKKEITAEFTFDELFDNPKLLDFEVKF